MVVCSNQINVSEKWFNALTLGQLHRILSSEYLKFSEKSSECFEIQRVGSLLIPQQYVYWYVGHYLPPSHHAIGSPSQVLQLIELFTELHQISARTGESTFQNKITVLFLEVLNASEKWFNTLTLSQLQNFILFYLLPKNPDFWPIFEYQQISSLLFSGKLLLIFFIHMM